MTMKKTILHIIAAAVSATCFCACYEDLSTEATTSIPSIVISTDTDVINVAYGHEFTLDPEVSMEGRSESDFSYLWEIDLIAGRAENRIELGTEKSITYKAGNTPSDSPYILTLKVTDNVTGLAYTKIWEVYVSSSLGEGILVASTRDGGQTSDLSLLTAKPVTFGYASDEPLTTHELFSFANGSPVEGRINAVCNQLATDGATYNTSRILIGTDEHLIALSPLDYKEVKRDGALFNGQQKEFGTTELFNFGGYITGAVINGKLYGCICNIDQAFSTVPMAATKTDVFTHTNFTSGKPDQGRVAVFNEYDSQIHNGGVLNIMGSMVVLDRSAMPAASEGAKCLGAGILKNMTTSFILKYTDGSIHLLTMDLSLNNPIVKDYSVKGATDIENAVSFGFCDNADIVYYATDSKIYSVIISGSTITVKALNWKPDNASERITGIQQFSQCWYAVGQNSFVDYEFELGTHRKQVLITTYNEETGEGKIYLRPYNVSTGLFTFQDNGSYGGFGEITAITTTLR